MESLGRKGYLGEDEVEVEGQAEDVGEGGPDPHDEAEGKFYCQQEKVLSRLLLLLH